MISRRNARVKVMQGIYAHLQDESIPTEMIKKTLTKSIHQVSELYYYCLFIILNLAEYTETDADIKEAKYIKTDRDKLASRKMASDPVVLLLKSNKQFKHITKKLHFGLRTDQALLKKWLSDLQQLPQYKNYIEQETHSNTDPDILSLVFKKILLPDDEFHTHIEELFPLWVDDNEPVIMMIKSTLNDSRETGKFPYEKLLDEKTAEIDIFAQKLFDQSIAHIEEYDQLIAPKLTNWEVDRIALIDMILMRMALGEILGFPTIPIKVTMNEYIDISKRYSTPKSREFINGVLDNLTKELKEAGKIKKTGRGLLET